MRAGAVLVAVAGVLTGAATAGAQDLSPAEVAVARSQFQRGLDAAHAERWPEAYEAFARAYAVYPRPLILLNLATAQARTGRLVEAAEGFQRFALEATTEPAASHRDEAARAAALLEPRIPHVRLDAPGLASVDAVALDGVALRAALLGVELPVDPGAHVATRTRDGATPVRVAFTVAEAQRLTLTLPAPVATSTSTSTTANATPHGAPARRATRAPTASRWPWIALGGGLALVVGLAVVGAVVFADAAPGVVGNLSMAPLRVH